MTTKEASIEEAEDTTRLSERLQPRRRRCFLQVQGIDNYDGSVERVRQSRILSDCLTLSTLPS